MKKLLNKLFTTVLTIVLLPVAFVALFVYTLYAIWVSEAIRLSGNDRGLEKIDECCGIDIKATKGLLN